MWAKIFAHIGKGRYAEAEILHHERRDPGLRDGLREWNEVVENLRTYELTYYVKPPIWQVIKISYLNIYIIY